MILLSYITHHSNCISLILPATNISWNKCKKQIENMICYSSEYPEQVIVVISNSGYNQKKEYITYCNYKIYLYFRKYIQNSASNKNYGSKYAYCRYIGFFDSDDIMSKNRIEIIHHIIKHYSNFDIIMHMYSKQYTDMINNYYNKYNVKNYFFLNSSYISYMYKKHIKTHTINLWYCCNFLNLYNISNGWITISKNLYKLEQFNEDTSIQRAEDSEYNGRVISKGYKALILRMILGYYSKRNECNTI